MMKGFIAGWLQPSLAQRDGRVVAMVFMSRTRRTSERQLHIKFLFVSVGYKFR